MNSSFIHADIFFFITSLAVIVLTALLIIFFYYIVKIARHLEHASKRLMEESDRIMDDVSMVRESIEEQGGKFMSALRFIFGAFVHSKGSSGRPSSGEKSGSGRKTKKTAKGE